jgi:hypothetical protein
MTTAENDYAFATTPGGRALVTRRNNLAQRNLTVSSRKEMRSARFPFVVGHPANPDLRLELLVNAGALARLGEVYLDPGDASDDFPAAKRAQALAAGRLRIGKVTGGEATKLAGRPAIRLSPRAVIEIVRPARARYALRLVVTLPPGATAPRRYQIDLMQRVAGRGIVGGATVVVSLD